MVFLNPLYGKVMGKVILVTGGARSGKSSYALRIIDALPKSMEIEKYYIATALPIDEEMSARIQKHKDERGKGYKTIENAYCPDEPLKTLIDKEEKAIIIDCITVWMGNIFHRFKDRLTEIEQHADRFVRAVKSFQEKGKGTLVIITNEVGCGIVPEKGVNRKFRDMAGLLNQSIAQFSDRVVYCVCGIPTVIKGPEDV
jgi:adenosylcobinamide kinase/adenosylcobinamide-phosphate guanylyltransferase